MITSIGRDEVQLMDMESYETYEIEKPGIEIREGKIYEVVKVGGKRYILREKGGS
jgi:nonsense-mediated mRNA decay protein 3